MTAELRIGSDLVRDEGVILGYRAARLDAPRPLVIGDRATLRSGTVIYEGTRIGDDFGSVRWAGSA